MRGYVLTSIFKTDLPGNKAIYKVRATPEHHPRLLDIAVKANMPSTSVACLNTPTFDKAC
eukprot:4904814-Amphidinium_carterae.1